ncbi:unnamed protein product [Kluyveromyces dobzhanskii CBS 2104]|uniref:WGS project CCBQ000000000 data, contig 00015 n=1 Tax=Kluyveromyces dobzhanskii CBS 2104 TaxID=1427455 RepID=A0A0A8LC77_9SACH|nr:unnamed protein product [Kluyveromyces dobzhanskii CBS 2104]
MIITKKEFKVNDNLLWQHEHSELNDDIFSQQQDTTMMFGVFYLDELVKDRDQIILKSQLTELAALLEPWNKAFPWNGYNGVSLEIREILTGEYYIFGTLEVGNNARDEESLVLSILLNFSKQVGPCTFIKVCDTDGEFILMEANEVIPKELEFPISNNRIWLTMGKISYIPTTFYYNRGLDKQEALTFLKRDSSKVSYLPVVEDKIRSSFTKVFPDSTLQKLRRCRTEICDKNMAKIINCNPKIVSAALTHFMSSTFETSPVDMVAGGSEALDIIAPESHFVLMKKYFELQKSTEKVKLDGSMFSFSLGAILVQSIYDMINKEIITVNPYIKSSSESLLHLLKSQKLIPEYVIIEQLDWDALNLHVDEELNFSTLDSLKSNLMEFLNDESDINGIVNDDPSPRNTHDKDESGRKPEPITESDSDASIDEDDFFEFFLKNGLNLPDEYIANLRSHRPDQQTVDTKKDCEDVDSSSMSESETSLEGTATGVDTLDDLIKSLTVDGAPSGPLQTILGNLS